MKDGARRAMRGMAALSVAAATALGGSVPACASQEFTQDGASSTTIPVTATVSGTCKVTLPAAISVSKRTIEEDRLGPKSFYEASYERSIEMAGLKNMFLAMTTGAVTLTGESGGELVLLSHDFYNPMLDIDKTLNYEGVNYWSDDLPA